MTRADLIAALREAREGSEELDRLVYTECGGIHLSTLPMRPMPYTRSIDAALTLHEDYDYTLSRFGKCGLFNRRGLPCVEAATPALAICLARLEYDNLKGTE